MKTIIRVLALTLAFVMCFTVVGCKNGEDEYTYYSYYEDVPDDEVENNEDNNSSAEEVTSDGSVNSVADEKTSTSSTDNSSEDKKPSTNSSAVSSAGKKPSTNSSAVSSAGKKPSANSTVTSSGDKKPTANSTTTSSANKKPTANSTTTSSANKKPSTTSSANKKPSTNTNANEYVDTEVLNSREEYEAKHDVYNHPELKGKTVKFATWIDHSTTEAQYAVESFESATGMKYEWVQVSQFGYLDTMTKLIAAGNAPDVFVGVGDGFPKDYQIAQPVDKISTFDIKDPIWDKDWMDTYKLGNHYYMLNTKNSIWKGGDLCYYNRTLLEDNGIMTPQEYYDNGEWSLEAMFEIMKKTSALGDKYYGGLIDPKLMSAALGAGLGYWKNGSLHNGCNSDLTYQAWRYFYMAKEAGYYDYGVTRNDFAQGRAAIWMDDVYALKSSGYFSSGIDENMLGWIQLPSKVNKTDSDQENNISAIPRVYGVCAGAKNPEGAVLFLRYFLDPLNYDWDSAFLNEEAKEYYLTLNDVTSDQRIYDRIGMTPSGVSRESEIGKIMFFTTSAQLKTSLDSINSAVNAQIKDFNKILDEVKKRDK